MPKAVPAKAFLAKISSAWSDSDFLDAVSRTTSLSIQSEISSRGAATEHQHDVHDLPQLAQNAAVLSFMSEALSVGAESRGVMPEESKGSVHRLAKLWESLSKICHPAAKETFSLNAACAYELAGYQANARCMARAAGASAKRNNESSLQQLVNMFIQRKLVQMRSYCEPIMSEPDYDNGGSITYRLAMASAAASLSNFASSLLSGSNPQIEIIMEDLDDAKKLFHMSGFHTESSLAHSVKSILGPMWLRSTWSTLGCEQKADSFAWNRYLVLLARGLGSPVPSGTSISEMWPSQLKAVNEGLLSSNESKIVRMPTSTGKTRIAEMAILHALTTSPAGASPRRCVYVAPYRALVSEITRTLSLVFPDMGFSVSGMDGAYDSTPLDAESGAGPDILVLTPEKLDIISRTSPRSLDGTALFVIDEGHVVSQGSRGARIEMLLTRLRRRFAGSRFILLSAMLSDDAMRRFAAWLRCGGATSGMGGIISTDWKPTMQRIAKFEWVRGGCSLTYEPLRINLRQREVIDNPIVTSELQYKDQRTGRRKVRKFPAPEKGEIAAELAFRYSVLGPVMVYATTPRSVVSVARKMHERVRLAKGTVDGIPSHFEDRDRLSAGVSAEWLGPKHMVTCLLRSGIAVHYGDLPHALRQAIESDVSAGEIRAVVATNTLSQGVNLPVRTIIVHSCRRYSEEDDQQVRIPEGEYWNLAGRAGRAGHETEGTVIHIVMTPSDAKDFDHYVCNCSRPLTLF